MGQTKKSEPAENGVSVLSGPLAVKRTWVGSLVRLCTYGLSLPRGFRDPRLPGKRVGVLALVFTNVLILLGVLGWAYATVGYYTSIRYIPHGASSRQMGLYVSFCFTSYSAFLVGWQLWVAAAAAASTRLRRGGHLAGFLGFVTSAFFPLALFLALSAAGGVHAAIRSGFYDIPKWLLGAAPALACLCVLVTLLKFDAGLRTLGVTPIRRVTALLLNIAMATGLALFCVWIYGLRMAYYPYAM